MQSRIHVATCSLPPFLSLFPPLSAPRALALSLPSLCLSCSRSLSPLSRPLSALALSLCLSLSVSSCWLLITSRGTPKRDEHTPKMHTYTQKKRRVRKGGRNALNHSNTISSFRRNTLWAHTLSSFRENVQICLGML